MEVRKNGQGCPQTRIGESAKTDSGVRKNDREIDKINNINKINNIDNAAFSWFEEEEEEERKKKIVEPAKQIRLAAIRKNPDNRFRDEEEQEYFDFIKGVNVKNGMSSAAAEEDAWQMILDEREYNVSKIS